MGTGKSELFQGRAARAAALAMSLGLLCALWPAATPQASAAAYEPNDSTLSAAGPLRRGQTVFAAMETFSDRDFFYFYVTSPGATEVTLTVSNLGGGSQSSDIAATIIDSEATPVGGVSFVSGGETDGVSLNLEPQKYFVQVAGNTGFGDSYSLTGGGGTGAFGTYEEIAGRCAAATAAVVKGKRRLRRAQAKLQRTTARVRRSRIGGRRASRAARRAHRRAKRRRTVRRRALSRAQRSRAPWCYIPR